MRDHPSLVIGTVVLTGFLTLGTFRAHPASAPKQKAEWLPLCGKCLTPTIFTKSGIGTAHAVAEARVTYLDAVDHCEQWSMEDHPNCDKEAKETLKDEKGKVYTATANCVHGKLTIADGENFVYAGLWPNTDKYLAGKTRWRWGPGSYEDTGKIVGWNGPTRAPMVAATAKLLCPNGVGAAQTGSHK